MLSVTGSMMGTHDYSPVLAIGVDSSKGLDQQTIVQTAKSLRDQYGISMDDNSIEQYVMGGSAQSIMRDELQSIVGIQGDWTRDEFESPNRRRFPCHQSVWLSDSGTLCLTSAGTGGTKRVLMSLAR